MASPEELATCFRIGFFLGLQFGIEEGSYVFL
jgi:hypothetical protein